MKNRLFRHIYSNLLLKSTRGKCFASFYSKNHKSNSKLCSKAATKEWLRFITSNAVSRHQDVMTQITFVFFFIWLIWNWSSRLWKVQIYLPDCRLATALCPGFWSIHIIYNTETLLYAYKCTAERNGGLPGPIGSCGGYSLNAHKMRKRVAQQHHQQTKKNFLWRWYSTSTHVTHHMVLVTINLSLALLTWR